MNHFQENWKKGLVLSLVTVLFWSTLPVALKISLSGMDALTLAHHPADFGQQAQVKGVWCPDSYRLGVVVSGGFDVDWQLRVFPDWFGHDVACQCPGVYSNGALADDPGWGVDFQRVVQPFPNVGRGFNLGGLVLVFQRSNQTNHQQ